MTDWEHLKYLMKATLGFAISGIRSGLAVDIDANGMVDLIVCSPGTTIPSFRTKTEPLRLGFGVGSSRLTELDHNISNPEYLTVSDIDGDADQTWLLRVQILEKFTFVGKFGSLKFAPGGKLLSPSFYRF